MTTIERPQSGSERSLDQPVMTFDLPAILAELKREPNWQKAHRNSIALLKQPELRVVLVALQAGAEVASHQAESPVTIQVVEGRVTVRGEAGEQVLGTGMLLTLWAGVEHSVYAGEESAFLLTLVSESLHPMEVHVVAVSMSDGGGV